MFEIAARSNRTLMSKNFELLQRIGNVEALFETSIQGDDAVPAAKDGPNLALDKETFERIILNASLPDVFETVTDPPLATFGALSELRPDVRAKHQATHPNAEGYSAEFPHS